MKQTVLRPQHRLENGSKKYVIVKELGKGQFGTVYEAIQEDNFGIKVAIKTIDMKSLHGNPKAFQLFNDEVTLLQKINNPNVVAFVDYFYTTQTAFLVLEYCDGSDLHQCLRDKGRFSEDEAIQYFKQIVNGLQGLHALNIVHRDLKLPNILMHNGQIKIADLGFAKQLQDLDAITMTVLGTPLTMAPEVLENRPYGMKADVYSLGVIFYQMLYGGNYPFNARSETELIQKQKAQNINFNVPGYNVSQKTADLVRQMLTYDIKNRINWTDIYSHSIFKEDEVEQAFNDLNYGNLMTSKINIVGGGKMYQEKQDALQYNNGQSYQHNLNPQYQQQPQQQYQQQQNYKPIFEQPVQKHEVQIHDVKQEEYQNLLAQNQKREQIQNQIKSTMELYLNEWNILSYLGKTVYQAHMLPQTQINTFYPVYFLLKRCIIGQRAFIQQLEGKVNIFNFQYFNELVSSQGYRELLNTVKQSHESTGLYLMARRMDIEDLMQQTPNPDIIEQLGEDANPNFIPMYRRVLINYKLSLDEEAKANKNQPNSARSFLLHAHSVVDCLMFDQIFRNQKVFDFQIYENERQSMGSQRLMEEIEKKFLVASNQ